MNIAIVLALSMIVQFVGAAYSLYLIKITGPKRSWVFLSAALVCMGLRRLYSLTEAMSGNAAILDLGYELVGLLASVLVLVGFVGVRSIFVEWKTSREEIRLLLDEKELLLREVHHRVKNNMATVGSLLKLQAGYSGDESTISALDEAANRVAGMAVLYDKLYRQSNYREMSVKDYLDPLIEEVFRTFPNCEGVSLEKDIEDLVLDQHRLYHIGIVINEIVTNSMKYAFAGGHSGCIRVVVGREGENLRFLVEDDGCGLSPDDCGESPSGFGMTLIKALVEDLGGNLSIESDHGTRIAFAVKA